MLPVQPEHSVRSDVTICHEADPGRSEPLFKNSRGKTKKTEDISEISLNFPNLYIQISNHSDFGKKKMERKAHQFKGKKLLLIRTSFQISLGSRNPPNQPVLLRKAFDANLIMLPW